MRWAASPKGVAPGSAPLNAIQTGCSEGGRGSHLPLGRRPGAQSAHALCLQSDRKYPSAVRLSQPCRAFFFKKLKIQHLFYKKEFWTNRVREPEGLARGPSRQLRLLAHVCSGPVEQGESAAGLRASQRAVEDMPSPVGVHAALRGVGLGSQAEKVDEELVGSDIVAGQAILG